MNKKIVVFAFVGCLAVNSMVIGLEAVRASDLSVPTLNESLNLKDILDVARRDNPEIRVAREKWKTATSRVTIDSSLPDLRIDFERMYAPLGKNPLTNSDERNILFSQEVPFPSTLALRRRAAQKEALVAEAAYKAKGRDVLYQVKSTYIMLGLNEHHLFTLQENIDLMRTMASSVKSRYSLGRASMAQVLKTQVELSRMLNMKITMEQEIKTNQAMLDSLHNRDPGSPLASPLPVLGFEFHWTLNDLTNLALEKNTDLSMSLARVEKSRLNLKMAHNSYLPEFMLSYRRRDMKMEHDTHDAMLGVMVPLWFWKQRGMVKEATAELEMVEAEKKSFENQLRYQLNSLVTKLDGALRVVQLYESSVLPQARQALNSAESSYQAGKMELTDLIDANRTLLNFHDEYFQAKADSHQLLFQLELLVGEDLDLKTGGSNE